MHITGIIGSPRPKRNTAVLVGQVLAGAAERGAHTASYTISQMQIAPCNGCEACKHTAQCVIKDDMHTLYAALNQSQGLVLGTPIYFDHVSAQTKTFLDRLYAYLGPQLEHYYPPGVAAVLAVCYGDGDPALYEEVVAWLRERLSFYYGIHTLAVVKLHDADARPAARRPEALAQAFAAGQQLVDYLSQTPHGG